MPDNEARKRPGEPLRIQAETWNSIIEMLRAYKRNKGIVGANDYFDSVKSNLQVIVNNNSLDTFSTPFKILRILNSTNTITVTNRYLNNRRMSVNGDLPVSSTDPIVILQKPAISVYDASPFGVPGVLSGLTFAYVRINSTDHEYANPIAGVADYLDSAESGQVRILQTFDEVQEEASGAFTPASGIESGSGSGAFDSIKFCLVNLIGATGGGSSSGSCDNGLGWVAGLPGQATLKATVCSVGGRCACDGEDLESYESFMSPGSSSPTNNSWTADDDIVICGVTYTLSFNPRLQTGNWRYPLVSITDGGSKTEFGQLDSWGDGWVVFAFGDPEICTGDNGGDCAKNTLKIRIECVCNSIDGWEGPGFYCVRDIDTSGLSGASGSESGEEPSESGMVEGMLVGATNPCRVVELLEQDRCNSAIEICSGPYATQDEAELECGTVVVDCSVEPVRKRLYIRIMPDTGCLTCTPSAIFELIYDSTDGEEWLGEQVVNDCLSGPPVISNLKLVCNGSTWELDFGNTSGCLSASALPATLTETSPSDPLLLQANVAADFGLCCAGAGSFNVYISDDYATLAGL